MVNYVRMDIKIVGTGHILQRSVEGVREAVFDDRPDIVALELCEKRFHLINSQGSDFYHRGAQKSAWCVISDAVKEGSFLVFMGGILALVQQNLGERYGLPPGSDMFAAIQFSREISAEIVLIDRDIEVTVSRLVNIPFREILGMLRLGKEDTLILGNLFGNDLSSILEENNVEKVISIIRTRMPYLYTVLVDERDRYMAISLYNLQINNPYKRILAVVGAGHKKGILRYIKNIERGKRFGIDELIKIRPVSKLRVLAMSFIFLFLYILIKIQLWIKK